MLARLQSDPLDVPAALAAVADPACGGQALFVGLVRDHDGGRAVAELSYEAHPQADVQLQQLCAQALGRDGVRHVAAVHRTGVVAIGEAAVVVAVSSPHRAEALDTCHWLIDAIKHELPIWKHQRFADGTDEWVGAC